MPSYLSIFQNTYAFVMIVLFFGGSIFVHEFGHFIVAKLRGLKVEKFSIGFGPKIFGWKGKDGCEYRISLLPLGGYVALPQLADMGRLEGAGNKNESKKDAKNLPPISYTDKILVSFAGAAFNILFAFVLALIVWLIGVPSSEARNSTVLGYVPEVNFDLEGSVKENAAYNAGLRSGDKILSIDGVNVDNFQQILEYVAMGTGADAKGKPSVKLKVLRGNETLEFTLQPSLIKTNVQTGDEIRSLDVFPTTPLRVKELIKDFPAELAGLKIGDEILALDGKNVYSNHQIVGTLMQAKDAKKFKLTVLRDGQKIDLEITPKTQVQTRPLCVINADGKSGFLRFINSNFDEKNPESASVKGQILLYDFDKTYPYFEGLQKALILVSVDGKKIQSLAELNEYISANPSAVLRFAGASGRGLQEISLGKTASSKIQESQKRLLLGYMVDGQKSITIYPTVKEQFSENIRRTYGALKSLLSPSSNIGLQHMSGPIGIGRVMYHFSTAESFGLLLSFVVLLNINLAFLNLLPIPVLDGGHILIATISKIMRRPVPESVLAAVQGVFVMLFLGLMAYVFYSDIMRWKGDSSYEEESKILKMYYDVNVSKER